MTSSGLSALVSVIARVWCVLLVAGLVAGAIFGNGLKHQLVLDAPNYVQTTAPDSTEPSRLCTMAGSAWALPAGLALAAPLELGNGALQSPRSLTADPKCDDAPPVRPPRTLV
jgi:hypothetical protein